jgi:hypothetical protein
MTPLQSLLLSLRSAAIMLRADMPREAYAELRFSLALANRCKRRDARRCIFRALNHLRQAQLV